jgi:uncharacterized protein YbaP (TraB family)
MKLIRLLPLVLMMAACNAQPQNDKLQTNKDNNTLLWEVSGNGLSAPSYLFGTFHLLCSNDIHFSNSLKLALKNVAEVYLELDLDDPSVMQSGLMLMNMNNGKKIKDLYTPEEYKKLEDFFKDSLQIPLTLFQYIKPAFLESMLYPKMMPCKTISGVDEELMKLAKEDKKEIRGLETMAFQASVFDSIPYEEQAKELLKTIDSMDTYKHLFDTMIMVYKSQHLKEIDELFSKSESGMEDHKDILLNNRNANWVKQLKDIMKKERVFVAVGAGHLVGEQGLIALLRKEGYAVRPLENAK